MEIGTTGLDGRLAKLKEGFLERLPARLVEIQRLWVSLQDALDDADLSTELRRVVHSLIGSSASFGFTEVSAAASSLGDGLRAIHDADVTPTMVQRIDVALHRLAQSVSAANGEAPTGLVAPAAQRSVPDRLVYLLDDDEMAVRHLSLQLERGGFQSQCFTNTAALGDALMAHLPGALVMGASLPEGGVAGTELIAKFRRQHAMPLPVIFLSERSDMAARLAAIRAGADGFLPKPVDVPHLLAQLNGLIGEDGRSEARILIVEDDPDQLALTTTVLSDYGFDVHGLSDGTQIEQTLTAFRPDLLLFDLYMPHVGGNELAALVRQYPQWQHLPVLFLSSESDPGVQLSTLRHGGDDFLRKPIAPELLIEAVRLHLKRARRRGQVLSTQSAPTPAGPHERLLLWLEQTPDAALLFLEPAADDWALTLGGKEERLSRLQQLAAKHFGSQEPLGYGTGLVLVLGGLEPEKARRAAEDLRDMAHDAGLPDSVVGLVLANQATDSEQLIESAGVAVQLARRGDGVHIVNTGSADAERVAVDESESQLSQIQRALEPTNVRLLFQPMISLQGRPVEYHEVLARLHTDASREGMPPSQFSELMGDGKLGRLLDQQVLGLALEALQAASATAARGRLLVKLSGASQQDPELALWVLDTLKAHGVSGRRLCLSLDATTLGGCLEQALPQLRQLQQVGCELCVEGFPGRRRGVEAVEQLKPRFVKLQRGLLYGIKDNEKRREGLAQMMATIRHAGARVAACFVEDAETLSVLYQCGADYAQGYFVQPPMALESYEFMAQPELESELVGS